MINSENNYYLKDDLLYKITSSTMYKVSKEEIIDDSNKMALLIDDAYFFYVGMENIPTSSKKLHAIASNFLHVLFPSNMVKDYGIFQHSGKTIIYIINQQLTDIIEENGELFSSFKKISTPFFEQCIKFNEFVFFDGNKKYMLSNNMVSMIENSEDDFLTAKDVFETMDTVKYSMTFAGINKKSALKLPLIAPITVLAIIYIAMVISGISEIYSNNKINDYYENALLKVYNNLGVSSSKDPYGLLVQQSKPFTSATKGQKILSILADLNSAGIDGIMFENINIRDDDIRVTGTAHDFAQVDEIKKIMENKLQASINIDDTKKTKDGISFTMKYLKDKK